MDTNLVDVDIQPLYVRVNIKSKILQLTLPYEVSIDQSLAQRNTTTGHLIITMPRLSKGPSVYLTKKQSLDKNKVTLRSEPEVTKRQYLEIGPPREDIGEMLTILNEDGKVKETKKSEVVEDVFVDDPNVPPLEKVF